MSKNFLLIFLVVTIGCSLLVGCNTKKSNIDNLKNSENINKKNEIDLDDNDLDFSDDDVNNALKQDMFKNLTYKSLSKSACDLTCEPILDLSSFINIYDGQEDLLPEELEIYDYEDYDLEVTILGRDITITGTKIGDFTSSLKETYAIARNYNGEHLIPPFTKVSLIFMYEDNIIANYEGNPLLLKIDALNYTNEYVTLNELPIYGVNVIAKDLLKWSCKTSLPLGINIKEQKDDFLIEIDNRDFDDETQSLRIQVLPSNSLEIHNYIKSLETSLYKRDVPKKLEDNEIYFKDTLYKLKETSIADIYNYFEVDNEDRIDVLANYNIRCESNFYLANGSIGSTIPLSLFHNMSVNKENSLDLTKEILIFDNLYMEGINQLKFDIEDDSILLKTNYFDNSQKFEDIFIDLKALKNKSKFIELEEEGLKESGKIIFSREKLEGKLSFLLYSDEYKNENNDIKISKVEFFWFD